MSTKCNCTTCENAQNCTRYKLTENETDKIIDFKNELNCNCNNFYQWATKKPTS